jgi:hypothetical protein
VRRRHLVQRLHRLRQRLPVIGDSRVGGGSR